MNTNNAKKRKLHHGSIQQLIRFLSFVVIFVLGVMGSIGRADDNLQLADKHARAAEEIAAIYAPSFDFMDHILKTHLGYSHTGIADNDWRDLPPIYKLETAYLSAERAEQGGGEKMLAMLSRALAQDHGWMKSNPVFSTFISREVVDGETLKFAELTVSDAKANRPTLTPEARTLAFEITTLCTSGHDARRVLVEHFGISPSRARTLVNERALKDAFERAFQDVGNAEVLDRALFSFVKDHDNESKAFRKNSWFDPWRGDMPPPSAPSAPKPDGPRPSSGGKGGLTWAKEDSGMRPSGFIFFQPEPPKEQSSFAQVTGEVFSEALSRSVQKTSGSRFSQHVRDPNKGYGEKGVPRFKEAVTNPRGLGGIILGNELHDQTGVKPFTIKWVSEGKTGKIVIASSGGEVVYGPVSRECAVVAHRLFFGADARLTGGSDDPAIGLLGAEVQHVIETRENRGDRFRGFSYVASLFPLVVYPAIADLQIARDLAFCDTFPRSLVDPYEESVSQYRMIQQLIRLANSDPDVLESDFVQPISRTRGWKISDVELEIAVKDKSLQLAPSAGFEQPPSAKLPLSFLTMYTFEPRLVNGETQLDEDGQVILDPIETFGKTDGLKLLPYLIATQEPYKRLNELAGTLAIARWAKKSGATMELVLPERSFEPIVALVMRSDRIEFLTRDNPQFDAKEVISQKATESGWLVALFPRQERCFNLKRAIQELRFAAKLPLKEPLP